MREKLLKTLAQWHASYPGRMLGTVIILTLIFAALSTQLTLTMRWSDLLPSEDHRTIQYNKIIEEFVSATSIIVVVQGEEERIKEFADVLAPRLLAAVDTSQNRTVDKQISRIRKKIARWEQKQNSENRITGLNEQIRELMKKKDRRLIQRVDYKSEIDFLRNHGLMLLKEDDLKDMNDLFKDPNLPGFLYNLNNSMEKEYVGQSESISTREKEDQAVVYLDGIQFLIQTLHSAAKNETISKQEVHDAADRLLLGEPYFVSYGKTVLILNAIPNFTMMDTDLMVSGTNTIQHLLDDLSETYPDVRAGLTGFIPIGHDEMVYSEQSLGYTTLIALIAILILLIISFRMWVAPVFAILNLLIGIVWAIGITAVVVGQLNIMTQMMAVILLGLGIDFSIHLISGFTEFRAAGKSIAVSMEETFLKSGKGIVTGGLTTAFAFLTMVISSSRGMKEMGLVTGTGLLAILLATFLVLPVFLVFRERRIEKKRQAKPNRHAFVQRDISFRFLGRCGKFLGRHFVLTIILSLLITGLMIFTATKITFDQNYLNIEPKGLTSVALQDTIFNYFDMSMDYALVLTDSPALSRDLAKQYRELGTVALTEDISLYLPSSEQQAERVPYIQEINRQMQSSTIRSGLGYRDMDRMNAEIHRLEMNIMEMQDMAYLGGQDKVDTKCKAIIGDPDFEGDGKPIQELKDLFGGRLRNSRKGLSVFQNHFAPYFKKMVLGMGSTNSIQLKDLPPSILDRYSNASRTQFLITVFPSGNVWQEDYLNRFTNDLDRISDRATGMPPVFNALITIIGHDGRNALFLTLVIVFLLLWADFRNPKHALMAMIPLAAGVVWMVGLMKLTGQQFTVLNIMGLPMIIGIGIDDGVHIVPRWVIEGRGQLMRVFASTGKAILLTSLTTMLAFGSLIFSIWRGFGQLGAALFVGVAACFLTTIFILSGIIGAVERRHK